VKYSFLRSLYDSALQNRPSLWQLCPPAALFGLVTLVVLAVGATESAPQDQESRQALTIDGTPHHTATANAITETPTPAIVEEATAVVTPAPVAPAEVPGPQPPWAYESNAVAMYEPACGKMLYTKNADMPLPPASLTKMMTLLVSVESGIFPGNIMRPGISAVDLKQATRSSVMGLSPEMTVTVQDLYFGLMLPSGNDAAIALAQSWGNYDSYIERMNQRAAELGMTNTHFTNPHGLDHPQLYSTARDLSVLLYAMMANPYTAWVASTPHYQTTFGTLAFNNGNKLLTTYGGTLGGKTGFTNKAGHTLAVSVERGGRRIDLVVLGSTEKFVDATALLDWAFNETSPTC
jgi:D-alanyl-D-alanine carboxypeptidase